MLSTRNGPCDISSSGLYAIEASGNVIVHTDLPITKLSFCTNRAMPKSKNPRTIDYTRASHEELDQYGMEMLVFGSPELTFILRGHLLIERTIETLITEKLVKPKKLFDNHRVTFEMKVNLADAMGLLPPAYVDAAKALNKIRNSYAHREDYNTSVEALKSLKIRWEPIQERAFAAAANKGIEEAAQLAMIFLTWSFLRLLGQK